jgi:Lipocalin-like domain
MRRILFLALCVIAMLQPVQAALGIAHNTDSLVGTWHLVRYLDTPEGGPPVYAFGNPPAGLFIFTADGHVSISIMRNPPDIDALSTDPDPEACIPGWYCAYFGTYTVNYERGIWVTHVLGGNIPAYLGTDQSRTFRLEGDTLTILESYTAGGQHFRAERVLRRDTGAHRRVGT